MMEWPQVDPDGVEIKGNKIILKAAQIDTIAEEDGSFLDRL